MKPISYLLSALLILLAAGCDNNVDAPKNTDGSWLIPRDEVVDGGPPKDGIPSIDDPRFQDVGQATYVDEDRLVTGIRLGSVIKAFPHQVMDHHEIANDAIGQTPYCLTYCPLTGTALAWDRTIDGEAVEYGVSGLLFRNNLIPYDRKTDSRYSQMQMRAVNGPRKGSDITSYQLVQTTWATWKEMYPESQVLTTDTGFNRNYQGWVYGENYTKENSGTLFPIQNNDPRLQTKERVHGVLEELPADEDALARVYVIDKFGEGVTLIHDSMEGSEYVVAGSTDKNLAVSYYTRLEDGTELQLEAVQDALPVVMKDGEGNRWDAFGYAVEGPRKGSRLTPTPSYNGYWFAWADFFPKPEIYEGHRE